MAIALDCALLCAFVGCGADQFGLFKFDQLLERDVDRYRDQVDAFTGAERLGELGQGMLGTPTCSRSAAVPPNPTTPWDSPQLGWLSPIVSPIEFECSGIIMSA